MYLLELAGEDDVFAAAEASVAAGDVTVAAPGIGLAENLVPERVERLAFTRRAGRLILEAPAAVDVAAKRLVATEPAPEEPIAVRARDVRGTADIDTQAAERRLGAVLTDAGATVDLENPASVLLALFAGDRAFLAWEVARSRRDFGDRAPTDRPFFQPGSMDPLLARAVVNLAGVGPDEVAFDPMCGTGGLLIEAGLVGARPVGLDAQAKMVRGARENLTATLPGEPLLARGDAATLPIREGTVDAVVFDAPYGRQSRIEARDGTTLLEGALDAAATVADRAVVVADRSIEKSARRAGWRIEARYERRVHRSLTRYVHVLAQD